MTGTRRQLAVVTGASTGIGYELAKLCAQKGFDLVVAADEPKIKDAAREFEALGAQVVSVDVDLATIEGVDRLVEAIGERPVDALLANAGHGLGHGFLDQDFDRARHVIDTNITGTTYLIRDACGILITGSIAGFMPGSLQAVYRHPVADGHVRF